MKSAQRVPEGLVDGNMISMSTHTSAIKCQHLQKHTINQRMINALLCTPHYILLLYYTYNDIKITVIMYMLEFTLNTVAYMYFKLKQNFTI